jgi:hypothetical protein
VATPTAPTTWATSWATRRGRTRWSTLLRVARDPRRRGNYDSTTATDYEHCGCKYEDQRQEELSHLSYEWTRAHTSPDSKGLAGGLPFRIDLRPLGGHRSGPRLILVHGNPVLNTVYWTEDRSDDFCLKMADQLGAKAGDVIAFGHTHKPWHRVVDGRHFLNTGSVGRPKDGDWRAGYVLVTMGDDSVHIEFVRVDYDLARATAAIRGPTSPTTSPSTWRPGGCRVARRPIPARRPGPPATPAAGPARPAGP